MPHGFTLGPRRAAPRLLLRVCVVGLLGSRSAWATIVEGKLPSESNFALFLAKYVYDFSPGVDGAKKDEEEEAIGQVELVVQRISDQPLEKNEPSNGRLLFLIFDDERTHWKKVRRRWETSTCEEKIEAASDTIDVRIEAGKFEATYAVRIREHVRPRFWYFGFVACDLQLSSPVRYRVHMKNDIWGWQSEFSLDHMGLFHLYAVFTVAFGLTTAATAYASRWQSSPSHPPLRDHPYLQLLLLSYCASLASCALFLTHYALFVKDGTGSLRIRFLAVVASTVANCTIFLIAILSSVGWAVTKFSMPNRRCFLGMTALVGGLSALTELHAEIAVDQSTKLFSYQSGPGVLALVLKIFIFCWFAYQTKSTYDEEMSEQLRRYYKFLGTSITVWSLNVPVMVLLAFQLSPWVRYKTVVTVEVIARFLGQLLLTQLFCGPLSPISAENTFSHFEQNMPLEPSFGQLGGGNG